jgi:hypothetical protein
MYLGRFGFGKVELSPEPMTDTDRIDIGYQGMVYVNEDTPYMRLLKPFLEKKKVSLTRAQVTR